MDVDVIGRALSSTAYTPAQMSNTAEVLARIKDEMLTARNGDRADRHNVVLLISGKASPLRELTITIGKQLKEQAKILSVGVGSNIDEVELGGEYSEQSLTINILL